MTRNELADLACRLLEEGPFEIYRPYDDCKSKKVWLTENERDGIVAALWSAAGSPSPKGNADHG